MLKLLRHHFKERRVVRFAVLGILKPASQLHKLCKFLFSVFSFGLISRFQEDTNCDNLTYKGNCEEIVAEDFLILKEDNPVTESKMKSQEDTSVKLGGDCKNDSSQTEPIQERCVKGGRKKGETKSILEERHKARLEEQERKLIEEGVRRSQRIMERNDANLIMEIDHYIPENFKEAMNSGERNEWHKAMEDELNEIEKHKVWTLVPRKNGMKVINSKWIYSTKKTPSDGIYKRKARLVAVGCNQRNGVDYKESFSPVLKKKSLRTIVALATQQNLTIKTYYVKTAYLHGFVSLFPLWNPTIQLTTAPSITNLHHPSQVSNPQESTGYIMENEPTQEATREKREGTPMPEIAQTRTLAEILLQFTAALSQAYDRKMDEALITTPDKLLRLPSYLTRKLLELFRKLRLATQSYFQVRQTLMDLSPESNEASFAKYFAMKLAGQAGLKKYYREKIALGMQLGLPQEVILETLTEGLPLSDQRLVRVVPPESLGEWFQLVQRIHGSNAPTSRHHEDQPPNMSDPYPSTPRRTGCCIYGGQFIISNKYDNKDIK
ncbi:hypothetical protein LAZ67_14001424 [Cordylochernes scorpioides]|uniref:Reverse transcriptase Ty1/copia-type domain-containing protein n=1 Tax=Cordylochernes scorpioides TaxID=51811 RepID=A0ABY6L640_9ARAC|nr:hypothetical protein LAZ67_14001424 [Cordylochernes scorpioides]